MKHDAMREAESHRSGRLRMPRSRGAVTGLLLLVLGVWGALIPFVGPYLHFAYAPDRAWTWTAARAWLEVLPGIVTIAGGVLLIGSRNRASAVLGGWLATFAGAWYVVGGAFAPMLRIGSVGDPVAATDGKRALIEVSYFSGLGAVIVFLGGAVLARLVARLARDVGPAEPLAGPDRVESAPQTTPEMSADELTEPPEAASSPPDAQPSGRGLFHRHRTGTSVK